jgi:hypothetical protein
MGPMSNPFPGVDPWLESSPFWQGFHTSFLTYLRDELRPALPEGYKASLEVRVYVDRELILNPPHERVPDVEIYREKGRGASTVLDRPEIQEGILLGGAGVERREAWLGIRSLPGDDLITSIEVLSPANKCGEGRIAYQDKQMQLASAGVNLVEVDMLRGGAHTAHLPQEWLNGVTSEYFAAIHRAKWPNYSQVIPWSLRDSLPVIPIPLAAGDVEPRIALQPIYDKAYENGDLAYYLRNRKPPEPRLLTEDHQWAKELLQSAQAGKYA